MGEGVVHVEPFEDVAKTGGLRLLKIVDPTATKSPEELMATLFIFAYADEPFIRAGVVHVEPFEDVAKRGALVLSAPTATNKPDELTATPNIVANAVEPFINAGVVNPNGTTLLLAALGDDVPIAFVAVTVNV
jgi:hypothetical protein